MSLRIARKFPVEFVAPVHLVATARANSEDYCRRMNGEGSILGIFCGRAVTFPLTDLDSKTEESASREGFYEV